MDEVPITYDDVSDLSDSDAARLLLAQLQRPGEAALLRAPPIDGDGDGEGDGDGGGGGGGGGGGSARWARNRVGGETDAKGGADGADDNGAGSEAAPALTRRASEEVEGGRMNRRPSATKMAGCTAGGPSRAGRQHTMCHRNNRRGIGLA